MNSSEQPSTDDEGHRLFSIIRGGKDSAARSESSGSSSEESSHPSVAGHGNQPGASDSVGITEDPPVGSFERSDQSTTTGENSGGDHRTDTSRDPLFDSAGVSIEPPIGSDEPGDDVAAPGPLLQDEVDAVNAIAAHATALLDDADPVVYYRALKGLVRDGHSSVLVPLEYSEDYSFHHPSTVSVEPAPSTVDTTMLYARAACPEFEDVLVEGFAKPARDDLLVSLYDLLFVERRNVAVVTNHGQIIDIALVMAALFVSMLDEDRSFGVLGEKLTIEELAERSNTLVSRMVTTRQAFGIPAIQVLQSMTRVFLTMPQTHSRRRAKLDATLVKANNALMRFELEKRLAEGGQILAMAASGTQDLTIPQLMNRARVAWRHRRGDDPGEVPTLHLQPIFNGTISLMRACDYVLPVAVSLDHKTPSITVGSLTRLREDEDCHRIMDWIALAHQNATGVPTIYHRPGDDLLTQVRSLIAR
ncbi:MAG: hypothetical protein KDB26_03270 [Microthrixaceae bacterium]|nr:hypothetical protein [Microthrixaceae bacterium]